MLENSNFDDMKFDDMDEEGEEGEEGSEEAAPKVTLPLKRARLLRKLLQGDFRVRLLQMRLLRKPLLLRKPPC